MKTERTVPLTDEQYAALRETFDWQLANTDILASLTKKLAEEKATCERKAWDTIYRLSGTAVGDDVKVDWVNRCIVVMVEGSKMSNPKRKSFIAGWNCAKYCDKTLTVEKAVEVWLRSGIG